MYMWFIPIKRVLKDKECGKQSRVFFFPFLFFFGSISACLNFLKIAFSWIKTPFLFYFIHNTSVKASFSYIHHVLCVYRFHLYAFLSLFLPSFGLLCLFDDSFSCISLSICTSHLYFAHSSGLTLFLSLIVPVKDASTSFYGSICLVFCWLSVHACCCDDYKRAPFLRKHRLVQPQTMLHVMLPLLFDIQTGWRILNAFQRRKF